ncbi:hypothetical protein ACFY0F_15850 [Streptomyces sp. NPDC001544]|uniref:hypothetical protein n=1 Tax=Streptomyces sp. NPDC001544 TaxID=3364584 RepID=UPI00367BDA0E
MPHDAVESVLDELYTTPPGRFVARREELAAAARTEGRLEDARRIRAARRPTLAAWAANLLLRSRPEESRQFLELGRALREAYRTLDAAGLKELSAQRRRIVSALSRQAAELASEAGHGLSDAVRQEVESTLRAVLADPDAADRWAAGRLYGALTPPSDFGAAAPPGVPRGPARRTAAPPPPAAVRAEDELAERRRQRRRRQLDRAREAAERAAERLRGKRAEQTEAEARLAEAERQLERAREAVRLVERERQQAEREQQRAEHERQRAAKRHAAAAEALARADREARETAERADRLAAAPDAPEHP